MRGGGGGGFNVTFCHILHSNPYHNIGTNSVKIIEFVYEIYMKDETEGLCVES